MIREQQATKETLMTNFLSDNVTVACPEVIAGVLEANNTPALPYGEDSLSLELSKEFSEVFETEVSVFPAITGTASNALALAALTPSYGNIYCHRFSHINTEECGAPELFTGGAKLIPVPGKNGKITVKDLVPAISGSGDVHHTQPSTVSITQASEAGTIYRVDQIADISETAHAHGLRVHMDGARFANALVRLDLSPAEITWKAGVDILSFGATKNGCLAAEAIIFFNPKEVKDFHYLHKRSGQLLSKMKFVSAQLKSYLKNGIWLRNARNANKMADRLSKGLSELSGVRLVYPTESNEVFVHLPDPVIEKLNASGVPVNTFQFDCSAARFVTAWNTKPQEVDSLIATVRTHSGKTN